jgi:hypothetical protein
VVRTSVGFINAAGAAIATLDLSPIGTSVVPVMIGNTGGKPSTPGSPALDVTVPNGFVLSGVDAGASPGITVPATWTCNGNSGVVRCTFPADSAGQPLVLAPGKYLTASMHLTADPAESIDVAARFPNVAARMQAALREQWAALLATGRAFATTGPGEPSRVRKK